MQSGISASEELQAQFNSLQASSDFGLLVTIENESLVPLTTLPSTSSSFGENLASLKEHVQPNEPLYLILRRYDAAPKFVAVTYVPDTAKVRRKMLFASTRLTLARELGSEHFREAIFVTTPQELTEDGFKKHDAHTKLDAPLTEEERTLGEVKKAEQEAGTGTGAREIHLSKNLAMPMSEDALAAIKEVGDGSGRTVTMLSINPETEHVELVPESPTPASIAELAQVISTTEPRFTFFRYVHTHNGAEESPVLFFYTCPAGAAKSIKHRMMYPLMKRAVVTVAEKEAGMALDKRRFEVEDPSEITEQTVLDELHPKTTTRQAFSRPKRPGR